MSGNPPIGLIHATIARLGWGASTVKLRKRLYRTQKEALADRSFAKAVYGNRRAGKTELFAAMCHEYGLPGETGVFAGPTVSKANDLLGAKLLELKRTIGLDFEMAKGRYTLPTGAMVQCRGLDSMPDVELLRGDRPPFAIIDECGAIKEDRLKYAIVEALQPSLADFWGIGGRGLILGGTPNRWPRSWWARICGGEVWPNAPIFKLDFLKNPFFANGRGQRIIDEVLAMNGWTLDSPEFLREYRGIFCGDNTSLVFGGYDGEVLKDKFAPGPRECDMTVMGVDFGLVDPCAWVVIRLVGNDIHVVFAKKKAGLNHPQIAAETETIQKEWEVDFTAGDAYGRGSADIKTLDEAYGVDIECVKYSDTTKAPRLDFANSLFQCGRTHIYESARLLSDEGRVLPWNAKRTHPLDGYQDHCVDAFLVALDRVRQDHEIEPTLTERELRERERRQAIEAHLSKRFGALRR